MSSTIPCSSVKRWRESANSGIVPRDLTSNSFGYTEVLARHLLFLQIVNNKALTIRERMEARLPIFVRSLRTLGFF